jgi:hypothetical protein
MIMLYLSDRRRGSRMTRRPHSGALYGARMAKSLSAGEAIVRDVRQLFALVGIPERPQNGTAGGYRIHAFDDGVHLSWMARDDFEVTSGDLGVDHPGHPLVRVERATTLAMEHAMAQVSYAAGFTVQLHPGVPSTNVENERDPKLVVVSGPEFRAWTSA